MINLRRSFLVYAVMYTFFLATLGYGEVRKATQEDFEWGPSDNTVTSPGGHVGHKLPRYWDNNAFSDNLTLNSNDIITKGPWVDIRAYGAVADNGVTDNRPAILAAAAALKGKGGVLFIPSGEGNWFGISTGIGLYGADGDQYSNITIQGVGAASWIKHSSDTTPIILYFRGKQSEDIKELCCKERANIRL
jgi:hypothetical protein